MIEPRLGVARFNELSTSVPNIKGTIGNSGLLTIKREIAAKK